MKLNDENGVGDKQRENVAITSSCKEISSYRDSMFILLNLLTDFGSEVGIIMLFTQSNSATIASITARDAHEMCSMSVLIK